MLASSQNAQHTQVSPAVQDLLQKVRKIAETRKRAGTLSNNVPPRKKQKKNFACESCDFSTNDKYHLKNHIKKNHMDVIESKRKAAEPTDPLLTCIKNFYCQFCGVKTQVSEFMDWHYKNCHGDDAVAEVLEFEDKPIRFRCKPCNKTYKEMQFLAPHLSIRHNINLPFECDVCHKYFITRNKMVIHKVEHDEGLKSFNCEKCPSKFIRECDLKLHVYSEHLFEKAELQCDICGKAFKTEPNLLQHERYYHKNERPFECDECDATFKRKCDLNRHIDMVHITKQKRARDFPCDMCNKSFTSSLGRYSHKRLVHGLYIEHKIYSCKYCESTFKRQPYLRAHVKMHHTGKVLKCKECGYLTRSNDSLNLHIKKRHPYLNHK
ncbi:hypothetical protein B566_EDAN017607 [Ephemera danica]|nr:hypothetical protein B566_EDAN017607 [Ephemera danica]